MEWVQFSIFVITMVGLFFWTRSESRSDYREIYQRFSELQKEFNQEMKDFHGRLCKIEEERNKILLRGLK